MNIPFQISLAQIHVTPGHPDVNAERIMDEIAHAKEREDDLLVFPEMALPGYLLGDEWEKECFLRDILDFHEQIRNATEGIAVVWGSVDIDPQKKGKDGRMRKYNAAFAAQNKKWIGKTYKTLLPNYREFDDSRHFASLEDLAAEQKRSLQEVLMPFDMKIRGVRRKIGVTICEDMWAEHYAENPTGILLQNGAEVMINISASPWTIGKEKKRNTVVEDLMRDTQIPFLYCNHVGTQNNGKNIFLFDGQSSVYEEGGQKKGGLSAYTEDALTIYPHNDISPPSLSEQKEESEQIYEGLVYGIQEFFKNLPQKKVVIGLSGGIDSAVSAALFRDALGAENVYAVNMPTVFNSQQTQNAAADLAKNLGIHYAVFPIQESVTKTIEELNSTTFCSQSTGEKTPLTISSLGEENIQARDRGGRVLAAIAASLGAVFPANGNKTEFALGYATLYGDINGAIAPLGDLYKGQVYDLAKYINKRLGYDVIPDCIIHFPPSAELSAQQNIDEGKGDPIIYEYHDRLLQSFIEERKDPEDILQWYKDGSLGKKLHLPQPVSAYFSSVQHFIEDLEGKYALMKGNFFKRVQAPPIIVVNKRAFGFDLREAQNGVYFTQRYKRLKKDLLKEEGVRGIYSH